MLKKMKQKPLIMELSDSQYAPYVIPVLLILSFLKLAMMKF